MTFSHHSFNLSDDFKNYTNNNDDGSSTETYMCTECTCEENRNNCNHCQANCTNQVKVAGIRRETGGFDVEQQSVRHKAEFGTTAGIQF